MFKHTPSPDQDPKVQGFEGLDLLGAAIGEHLNTKPDWNTKDLRLFLWLSAFRDFRLAKTPQRVDLSSLEPVMKRLLEVTIDGNECGRYGLIGRDSSRIVMGKTYRGKSLEVKIRSQLPENYQMTEPLEPAFLLHTHARTVADKFHFSPRDFLPCTSSTQQLAFNVMVAPGLKLMMLRTVNTPSGPEGVILTKLKGLLDYLGGIYSDSSLKLAFTRAASSQLGIALYCIKDHESPSLARQLQIK